MSDPTLYDEDIVLWSEQQAAAIRRLAKVGRGLPNELDIENVAEEIEAVGRSELAAVESRIQLIFAHLIKLMVEPQSDAVRHWRGEIAAFHGELKRRYAPSMRQRLDVDDIWRTARAQAMLAYEGVQPDLVGQLPMKSPVGLDDLLMERVDVVGLTARVQQAMA